MDIPKSEQSFLLFLNPSKEEFSLQVESDNSGFYPIEVSNMLGEIVLTESWLLTKGIKGKRFSLTESTKGLYFITIIGKGGQVVKKIIID